jgi:hypothetical protein
VGVLSRRSLVILCVATGIGLELGVHALSGRREAWDSAQYWTIGIPLALIVSGALGLLSRRRDWLFTFAIVPSQVLSMTVRSGEIGSLWPLAVALSSILSTPFVAAAFVGSRFRPKTAGPQDRLI